MANAAFTAWKQRQLSSTAIDFANDDIRLFGCEYSTDTPNTSTDDFLDDISSGARVQTSDALDNPTITSGVFDTDDEVLTSVPSSRQIDSIVVYLHTGTEGTSQLIANYDSGVNLPLSTNGSDVTVQVNTGSTKWFSLGWLWPIVGAAIATQSVAGGWAAFQRLRRLRYAPGLTYFKAFLVREAAAAAVDAVNDRAGKGVLVEA